MFQALLAVVWLACETGPSYDSAQEADTIEAYEAFLVADPTSMFKDQATRRLEELYFEKGLALGTVEAWDAYHQRFPEGGRKGEDAARKRTQAHYDAAMAKGDLASLEGFAKAFPKAGWLTSRAAGRAAVLAYGKLSFAETRVEGINLAEDPKGEKNGWGVFVDVTNGGDATFEFLSMTIELLGPDGVVLETRDYPLVSPTWDLPAEPIQMAPMKPGEMRTWEWSVGYEYAPKGFDGRVRVTPTGLRALP